MIVELAATSDQRCPSFGKRILTAGRCICLLVSPFSTDFVRDSIEHEVEKLMGVLLLRAPEKLVRGLEFVNERAGRYGSLVGRMRGDVHEQRAKG
jgi:hypothetical protein